MPARWTRSTRLPADAAARAVRVFTRASASAYGYTPYQIRRRLGDGEWKRVIGQSLASAGAQGHADDRRPAPRSWPAGSVLAGALGSRTWQVPAADGAPVSVRGHPRLDQAAWRRLLSETARSAATCPGHQAGCRAPCVGLVRSWTASGLARTGGATIAGPAPLQQRWIRPRRRSLDGSLAVASTSRRRRRLRRLLAASSAGATGQWRERSAGRTCSGSGQSPGGGANVEITRRGRRDRRRRRRVAPEPRLVLESIGWRIHTSPAQFQRDRERHEPRWSPPAGPCSASPGATLTTRPAYVIATVRRRPAADAVDPTNRDS